MNTPVVYMLIGLPGSGKSTFCGQHPFNDLPRVSSDKFIEEAALQQGKTYNEVFHAESKNAQIKMNEELDELISNNQDFIWDQTNLTPWARKKKLHRIPSHYRKVAVFFDVSLNKCLERNKARERSIPDNVIVSMNEELTSPSLYEGFNDIWRIQ